MAHSSIAERFAAFRYTILALFFLVLSSAFSVANAADLKFDVSRGSTGGLIGSLNTVGDDLCPTATTNGCDFDGDDDVVRTNDGVGYKFAIQVDPPGDEVYIDTVLKPGQVWDQLPGICDPFTSTITGDGTGGNPSALHCDLGFRSSFAADLTFVARILGTNPNGASSGIASAEFGGPNSTTLVEDVSGIEDVRITAQPHYNLQKRIYTGEPTQRNGVDGYLLRYTFWIDMWKHDTNGNSADDPDPIFGNEQVTGPVSFVEDMTDISPNAYLDYCPSYPNSSIFPYRTYNSTYPERSVLDGGTVTCSALGPTAQGQVTVTITDADLSFSHYPTQYSTGSARPGDRKAASFGWLYVFVPLADITAAGGELPVENHLTDFNPVSISGQQNFGGNGEDTSDNTHATTIREGTGSFSHTYRCTGYVYPIPSWCGPSWYSHPTSALNVWSGDGGVEPDQTFGTYTYYRNNSFTSNTDSNICTVFDARYMDPIPRAAGGEPSYCIGQCGTRNVDYAMEYGVGYADSSFLDASATPSEAIPNECSSSATNWHASYSSAQAAGTITKMRIRRLTPLRAGQANAIVTQFKAKSTPELTGVPSKTLLKSWGSTKNSSYNAASYRDCNYVPGTYPTPNHSTNSCGDRMFLNRSLARIEKTTLPGNTVNLINAGGKINFQLSPSFTAVSTGTTDNITIVDELPIGGEYVTGSAKQGGAPLEPVVSGNAASGYVLTWDLGTLTANDPIDPITFQMSTPLQTPNNTVLSNVARIDAVSDDSSAEQRGAVRPVTVTAPASMLMGKSVEYPTIQQDGAISYSIEYLNTTTIAFNQMSIIDVLPYDDDARYPPSNFSGTASLAVVGAASNSAQFYFTKDAPAGISTDPNNAAANDLATGSVKWCPATASDQVNPSATPSSGGASSLCPQTAAEVTAVRLEDTQALASGDSRSFNLTINTNGNFGGEVYTNQAQGTSDGVSLSPQTPFVKTVVEEKPGIGLAKTVSSVSGSEVTYHLRMDNLGNTAIANAALKDDLDTTFGADNYTITTQPAFVTAPASGGITLNAAFTGTGAGSNLLDPAATNTLAVSEFAIISVTVEVTNVTDQGSGYGVYQNSAEFTGTSPEGIPLTDKSNNGTDSDTNDNGTGTDSGEDVPTPATVNLLPKIETIKTADVSGFNDPIKVGDEIVYTITVKNTGNVILETILLVDTLTNNDGQTQSLTTGPAFVSADESSPAGTLKVGETATYTATYLLKQEDIDSGNLSNTVTATGTDPKGTKVFDVSDDPTDATGTDDPTKTPISIAPNIKTLKTADTSRFSDPVAVGDEISYTITVINTGNASLDNVTVVDTLTNKDGTALTLTSGPSFVSADGGSPVGSLKVGETATYSATYELTQDDINSLGLSNTVTATGEDPLDKEVTDTSSDPADTSGNEGPTTTNIKSSPAIETIKTADITAFSTPVAVGDVITYTITVKNTGNSALDNVALDDTLTNEADTEQTLTSGPTFVSADNGSSAGDLKVGETATYTATYKLTQDDIDSKGVSNTVTATGDDPEGTEVSDISDDPSDATGTNDPTKSAITPAPAVETIKTADTTAFSTPVAVDDVVTYTITVKNTGNVTLDSIELDDTLTNENGDVLTLTSGPTFTSADKGSSVGDLLVGETATYNATYKLTQADIDARGVSNTVTAKAKDPSDTEVSDVSDDPADTTGTDDPTKTAITPAPAVETVKTADTTAFSTPVAVDDVITYTITVKNTGNVTLNNVALDDTLTNNAGDTLTLTTNPTFSSADQGSAVGNLLVGETATYQASYKLTQADIDSKGLSNTATAIGEDPSGTEVSDVSDDPADATGTDDPTKTDIAPSPGIETIKTADTSGFSDPVVVGDEVAYTITVKNTGNVTLDNVALTDTLTNEAGAALSLTSGPTFSSADLGSSVGNLLVGETASYNATYALTQADIDAGGVSNTVTATGEDPSDTQISDVSDDPTDATGTDDPTKTITPFSPELAVLKTADTSGFSTPVAAGDEVSYTITVQNTGNVTLNSVALTDTLTNADNDSLSLASGPDYVSSDKGSGNGDLLVGEIATYIAKYNLSQADIDSGSVSNSVFAKGKDPANTDVSDISDDPTGTSGTTDDPTKTSFTPQPSMEVLKSSDISRFSTPLPLAGDTIDYTITVKNTGNVTLDSVALTDTLTDKNGNVLTLTSGPTFSTSDNGSTEGNLQVAETATYQATYQITQSDIDAGGVSNTVTAAAKDPFDTEVTDTSDDPNNAAGTTDPTTTDLGTSGIETLKFANTSAFSSPVSVDDVLTYSITVKNTGNTTISSLSLTDTLTNEAGTTLTLTSGPDFVTADQSSPAGTLKVGETATYSASYRLTQDDIDVGGVSNTVVANAKDPKGKDVNDISDDPTDADAGGPDDPTKTSITPEPKLESIKTADISALSTPVTAGDEIAYTITVKNAGNVTLKDVALADTLTNKSGATLTLTSGPAFDSADQSSLEGFLLVGETATYKATYELTQDDINAGGVSNTATATANDPAGTKVTDVSDDPTDATGEDDPTKTEIESAPAIETLKIADVSALSSPVVAGDVIDFSISVKNTGNVTLNNVALVDTLTDEKGTILSLTSGPSFKTSSQSSPAATLLVGETATYSASYTLTQSDIDAGGVSNTVKVNANEPNGGAVTDTSDDPTDLTSEEDPTKVIIEAAPAIIALKIADTSGFSSPVTVGDVITYTITAENTGNVSLAAVALADTLTNKDGTVLELTSGPDFESSTQSSADGILKVGETATYKATYEITQPDIDAGGVSNTVAIYGEGPDGESTTAVSDDPTNTNGEWDPTVTDIEAVSKIRIDKTLASSTRVFPYLYEFAYRIDVTNSGNVTQTNIQIEDDLKSALQPGTIATAPKLTISGFTGTPEVNANYDGGSDKNTLAGSPTLAPGETGLLEITVRVDFSQGYPTKEQGNTAYGTTDRITDPVESNDPTVTPEDETDTNSTSMPIVDTDEDGSPDADESDTKDRDGDGVADASDYDPTGHFYCEETGEILPGGLITVTGPRGAQTGVGTSNNITIMRDGSSGEFQFHVSAAGRYKLSYVLPDAGVASTERLPGDPLDLTSLLPSNPASLGGSQIKATGELSDFTADGNPFYIVFDIEENDPAVFNNNIPLKKCGIPAVTASKSIVGTPVLLASGATQITYLVGVESVGTTQVANLTLIDDLDSVFGSGNHTVVKRKLVSKPVSSGIKVNTAYDGSDDVNVLTTGGSLDPGEVVKVEFVVVVTPDETGTFTNEVIAGGKSPFDDSSIEESLASVDVYVVSPDDLKGLKVAKVAGKSTARIGDVLFYTITIENTDKLDRLGLEFVDHLPAGFTYRPGTAKIGDKKIEPVQNGRRLTWPTQDIAGNEEIRITLHLGVGAGAHGKEFINLAWVEDPLTGTRVSTIGKSVVRREIEHVFDCGEIIGKVFDDKNRDGYQNQGEPGLPGVRVATARGILIKTDKHGRYNVPCAAIPDEKLGSNFIIKLDTRTLPTGYRLTTENPRVVRLTRGKVTKLNFGASITRLVRIDLNGKAFVRGQAQPAPKLEDGIAKLIASFEGREPSAIRLSYHGPENSRKLAKRRLTMVSRLLNQKWKKANGPYRLDVETRFVAGR